MSSNKIIKRNGDIVEFDSGKIALAIQKAFLATGAIDTDNDVPNRIAEDVVEEVKNTFHSSIPTVEQVQDIVEKKIAEDGYFEVAKAYILYRDQQKQKRAEELEEKLKKIEKERLKVTKNNGQIEIFKKEKLLGVFSRAVKGYEKECRFGDLYDIFKLMLVDGITTSDIIKNLRKAAIDLITVENTAWQHVAGRLHAMEIYREACRNRGIKEGELYSPENYLKLFKDYINEGLYYKNFFDFYTEGEILEIAKHIDKDRDFGYVYSTVQSLSKRYLLNPNKYVRELPQEMYMSIALFLAIPEDKKNRLKIAKKIYDITSTQKLSLPTPTLLNARTNYHQLSSCFKLNVDDDLRSIYHNFENMAQISKFGGGVGVYFGHVRAKGAEIRGVKGASGGVIPWMKVTNDTAIAVNQLGARKGAVSPTLDVWHLDIHDFLEMQTETGDIRSKAFDLFPAVSVPDLFMQRVEENGKWTLFDPHEISKKYGKRLEDHFDKEFEKFYLELEVDDNIKLKETINAKDLMKQILKTTVETGMPYFFFRDTVNRLNPNKHVGNIYSTQLCTEICQNTSESKFIEEEVEDGTLAIKYKTGDSVVCNLASINMAKVNTQEEINEVFPTALRVLDNVITLNFFPTKETELTAKKYRSIGLGFLGLAEYLACNQMAYDSQEARDKVDELFERYAFATLDNSQKLAEERGVYELFEGSDWNKGILFGRDKKWYQKNAKTELNWEELINRVKKGIRFSYHLSPAPNTSTSAVVGTTAGLLPIYKKFFIETNSIAPTVTVAPNLNSENFWYYQEYRRLDMKDVIDMFTVIYKWIDQSASFEWMIDPATTSPADLYSYYMKAWKQGIKTVYYIRSLSGEVSEVCESCSG